MSNVPTWTTTQRTQRTQELLETLHMLWKWDIKSLTYHIIQNQTRNQLDFIRITSCWETKQYPILPWNIIWSHDTTKQRRITKGNWARSNHTTWQLQTGSQLVAASLQNNTMASENSSNSMQNCVGWRKKQRLMLVIYSLHWEILVPYKKFIGFFQFWLSSDLLWWIFYMTFQMTNGEKENILDKIFLVRAKKNIPVFRVRACNSSLVLMILYWSWHYGTLSTA